MADKERKSTMREFAANDQVDYYSRITSIIVNGKKAYELKGKFLDDLHKNAFSGNYREDAVKHIEYFLKIVDPIDLPNVNQDKLRVVVFLISLAGDAWRWFDGIKGSITSWVDLIANFFGNTLKFVYYKTMDIFTKEALWDYWKLGSDEIEPANEETYDLKETDHNDKQEIGNMLRYQGLEWYDALKDELKDEALRNKAIMEGLINEDNESSNNGWRR
nr:hypothetical protein [Tanacetum cinerariifolium]